MPVFLYTFAQNLQRTVKKRRWPADIDLIRCGVGLWPTDWNQAEAPPPGALCFYFDERPLHRRTKKLQKFVRMKRFLMYNDKSIGFYYGFATADFYLRVG